MRSVAICFLLVLAIAPVSNVAAAPADRDTFTSRVLDLTNAERANAGLPPLTLSPELQDAAQSYSDVLASSGCFAHTCGPMPDFSSRDEAAGYTDWTSLGENIAFGYATPEDVVAGWMASPGHRANILSPNFTEIGVGLEGTYWTQEFGARPDQDSAPQ